MTKPTTADGYSLHQLQAARGACYDLATAISEMLPEVVIVGGLVPSLLIDQEKAAGEAHVGTTDLDLGLQVGLLRDAHYRRLASRLSDHGFRPATDEAGEPVRHRWVSTARGALIDFLVPRRSHRKGELVAVDDNLAAIATPGLDLAFQDRIWVPFDESWPVSGRPLPQLPVCGPAAFVLLKALAFHNRKENKDAYDIDYVLRHFGESVDEINARLKPLLDDVVAQEAVGYLRQDFAQMDSIGPSRAAAFLGRQDDDAFRADVADLVQRLLRGLR